MASIQRIQNRANRTKPVSEKQRAEDEKLREELRNFDLKKFDQLLKKAVKKTPPVKDIQ